MPNLSQRELLSEKIFTNVLKATGKGIMGGVRALGATANLARSAIQELDPDFYSTITKPIKGIDKFKTPSIDRAASEWWRTVIPGAEQRKFLEFLESKGYIPDRTKGKEMVNGTWKNGTIYVVEVDYDENNKPRPLTDDKGKVVSFKYPLHFKIDKNREYVMTKSPSATGRRTFNQNTTTSTAQPTTPVVILRQYYKFLKRKGLGIYDPIESNVFGSFLVKKIGVSPNATRTIITRVTGKPFDRTRKLTPQQIVKIAQILSQRGII